MNKIIILVISVLVITSLFLLYVFGDDLFNEPLNKWVAGEPDKTCEVNSDCVLREVDCSVCGFPKYAVNKNWEPFCLFPTSEALCDIFLQPDDVACTDGMCVYAFHD
jgi:hypothetical protein